MRGFGFYEALFIICIDFFAIIKYYLMQQKASTALLKIS